MSRATLLSTSLAVALLPAVAPAQNAPEDLARTAFQRGVQAMQQRRYDVAINEFELSYGLVPRCSTQFNLAVALEQTQRYADALATLRRYQSECAQTMPPQNAQYLTDATPRLRARVGTFALRVTPASQVASVAIDGRPRDDWSGELSLDPGPHTLEIRSREGQVMRRDLTVTEGTRDVLNLTFTPGSTTRLAPDPYAPSPAPVAPGNTARHGEALRIESAVARASVSVDGQELGDAPVSPSLTNGRHQIELRADGFRPARLALAVSDGAVTRLTPRLERDEGGASADGPFYTRWWFWTIIGVAAVGGAVALTWELTRPTDNAVYTFQAVRP